MACWDPSETLRETKLGANFLRTQLGGPQALCLSDFLPYHYHGCFVLTPAFDQSIIYMKYSLTMLLQ